MAANKSTAITTVKQEVRLSEWSAQIESQQSSGLSVKKWCEGKKGNAGSTYSYAAADTLASGWSEDRTAKGYPIRKNRCIVLLLRQLFRLFHKK